MFLQILFDDQKLQYYHRDRQEKDVGGPEVNTLFQSTEGSSQERRRKHRKRKKKQHENAYRPLGKRGVAERKMLFHNYSFFIVEQKIIYSNPKVDNLF